MALGESTANVAVITRSEVQDMDALAGHFFRDISRQKQLEHVVHEFVSGVARLRLSRGTSIDLTSREREVLRLLASGASTSTISKKLYISHSTVRNHIQNTLAKLEVHNRLEAVILAFRNGLISTRSSAQLRRFPWKH